MSDSQKREDRGTIGMSTGVGAGAGIGMIFGTALGNAGIGLVLGSAVGLALGMVWLKEQDK